MSIDKENIKVTLNLKDYEEISSYVNKYKELVKEIKQLTYIDGMTRDSATIVIDKEKAENFIHPFSAYDLELEGLEDSLIIIWK